MLQGTGGMGIRGAHFVINSQSPWAAMLTNYLALWELCAMHACGVLQYFPFFLTPRSFV